MSRGSGWGAAAALAIAVAEACGDDGTGSYTGTAQGVVRDTALAALEGVTVTLRPVGSTTPVGIIATNAAGSYSFPGVSTGNYDVILLVPTAMQVTGANPVTVSITSGGTSIADFSLRYVPVSLATHVQPILTASCASGACHGGAMPQQGMKLTTADTTLAYTVNVASMELPAMDRIEPGNAATSYLVHKINNTHIGAGGSGSQMPLGAPALPLQTRRMIARWVTEGALDN
jgi:hypothetical protein